MHAAVVNECFVYVRFRKPQYVCPACHTPSIPAFIRTPYQRCSRQIQLLILEECQKHQLFSFIAARCHVSVPTVIRYVDHLHYAKPMSRKHQTIGINPLTHTIQDILPDRNF